MNEAIPVDRPTARIVLIGPGERILLFRAVAEGDRDRSVWFAPGGGVKPGETYEEAARRELREEVGLEPDELGPWVWSREHLLPTARGVLRLRERYFVVRTDSLAVDTSSFEDDERMVVTGHRWFAPDDVAATAAAGDLVAPRRLAELLPPILRGDYPDPPLSVGV